jgi:ElaB/YqjD/DUF883 family membrane-anchored ribosome-binding protein
MVKSQFSRRVTMADKTATIETAEDIGDVGQETPAGLRARIECLKAALADSRIGQSCREMGSKVDQSVREKPYHYIAGAAVVGVLAGLVAGLLIARKRD